MSRISGDVSKNSQRYLITYTRKKEIKNQSFIKYFTFTLYMKERER